MRGAKGWVIVLAAVLAGGCAAPDPAFNVPMPGDAGSIPQSSAAAPIPPAYVIFCARFEDQCEQHPGDARSIPLTNDSWLTLERINRAVNDSIQPMDDETHFGRDEYWTIPSDGFGSCHDYALVKRKDLIDAGFPEPALRLAIVVTPRGVRHAVLTVATDKGDFVLDNLREDVVAWKDTQYAWIERQDPDGPLGWVSLASAPDRSLRLSSR